MNLQTHLTTAMAALDDEAVLSDVRALMAAGNSYNNILTYLNNGVSQVGQLFEKGEYFIADLIVSGMIYRDALNILMPIKRDQQNLPIGRIVIGVVAGDIHDLGKDIVVSLLRAEHFEVIDLGIDVKPERFAYAVQTYKPDVLLLSGVLSYARESMKETLDYLRQQGLRDSVPVLIGGMCCSEYQMKLIGADGWAYDTADTVAFCKKAIKEKYGSGQ